MDTIPAFSLITLAVSLIGMVIALNFLIKSRDDLRKVVGDQQTVIESERRVITRLRAMERTRACNIVEGILTDRIHGNQEMVNDLIRHVKTRITEDTTHPYTIHLPDFPAGDPT